LGGKIKAILETDDDLNFLLGLKKEELEKLVVVGTSSPGRITFGITRWRKPLGFYQPELIPRLGLTAIHVVLVY
jgi:hypothetical protein